MSTQSVGTDGSYESIIIGGAPDWEYYTQIRKVKTGVTVYPGRFVSGNGETDGEVDLAASGDEDTSYVELVLERVGAIPQDIDTGITAGQYVKTLRYSGGRFKCVSIRADESTTEETGQLMSIEADGMLQIWAYTDTAEATDVIFFPALRLSAVSTDVAATDILVEIWW
jgi:hypothetical protein